MAQLSIRNVSKRYGETEVLKGIDISVADGELLILVGPSGCGKSTLLHMIAGLIEIGGGEIVIGDRVVNDVSPKHRDIAMVFQSYALYPSMTVRENIEFALEMRAMPKAQRSEAVARVARTLQIEQLLERRPAQLSGGQRQRVAMGRALARDPAVFLFDEPLSNLDAKLRTEMRAEIKALHRRLRKTIVYVTHDQVEAMTLGDRIAVMKSGSVQQFGTPEDIYERPANMFVAGFIGAPAMNMMQATVSVRGGRQEVSLRGALGETQFALPATCRDVRADRQVVLGLRAEHFQEAEPGAADAIPLRVDLLETTGAESYVFSEINGRRSAVRVPGRRRLSVGDTLWVRPELAAACLFDPATEQRLSD
ncbi:MAG TPA: sn-glycerol-3-phosphate ABC transporter ATP-binding protein UgpC [Trinickia sp.]|uniref:ABC transporter ATP-binding protein n=1 Tax=Trinickia sp. TaxID=2571163 RepID=UPI002C84E503|nr:sn-glycerol-3-phosphate ABC transporter ATP-binding protein UgpC [Trinickia sp.]HVW50563.1 sn-glycerol-3-phosphate ABC transporter ATP-binding protein UgpC [Trinickia sp.]